MKLTGKNVVIVGGSQGIGFAAAKLAKENGANVIIAGRGAEKLQQAAAKLGNVQTFVADYTDESSVNNLFANVERVDHVYVAAGAFVGGTVLEGKIEDFQTSFSRIWGNTYIVRAAAPKMAKGGSFVFTGGVSTARPVAGAWATAVATAGSEQMARALAVELAPIRVNAVAPGWTDTPMWNPILGEGKAEVFQNVAEKLLIKRLATAEEIAQAVIFLMSNDSITGEVIHIDGGGRIV